MAACEVKALVAASTDAPPFLGGVLAKLRSLWRLQKKRKALAVHETVSLGDRRFVAVVQCGQQRFLIGASPSAITLLSPLPDAPDRDAASTAERTGGTI